MLPSSGCSQHGVICGECRQTRYNKYLLISIMCTWNRAVFSLKIWRECRMNYKYYSLQMNNIWILIQNIIIMHLNLSFTSQLLFIQLAEVQSKGSVYFKDALKCCVPIFSVAFLLLLNIYEIQCGITCQKTQSSKDSFPQTITVSAEFSRGPIWTKRQSFEIYNLCKWFYIKWNAYLDIVMMSPPTSISKEQQM